jgi:hypothetical protein
MFSLRLLGPILSLCALALVPSLSPQNASTPSPATYFGFDRNDYPGDDALPALRETFSFASYWLGPPPGEKRSSWLGKRALLQSQGFGFAVLFNGRESRALRNSADARRKAALDAQSAVKFAEEEGFAKGTVIFLDIEEGGRLPAPYHEYLQAWSDTLGQAGYRAGVYCSAIPVDEGQGVHITTAQDIQTHLTSPGLIYWVYNDACPPAPGCAFPANPPPPTQSGSSIAAIWQYAQSPRRKEFTVRCPANYAADGNCYAPGDAQHRWFLDANVATTPDPSSSR